MSSPIHPAALPPDVLLAECEETRTRRSGPGGQHRNKVETAIILAHRPTQIRAEGSERRSQSENRAVALFRLRVTLALEVRLPWDAERAASPVWTSRCHGGRLVVSDEHDDFPALLAEALDCIYGLNGDHKAAGELLACTPSQLLRLLRKEPRALLALNQSRQAHGLHPLR